MKERQVLVWCDGKYKPKTLPLSAGGRIGRTTTNQIEANELYLRIAKEQENAKV